MNKLTNKSEWIVTTNAYIRYHPDNLYEVNNIKDGKYEWPGQFIGTHKNDATITKENPIIIDIDLNSFYYIDGLDIYRRHYGGGSLGFIRELEIYISVDNVDWEKIDYKNLNDPFIGDLYEFRTIPKLCKSVRLKAISAEYEKAQQASYEEIDVYGELYQPQPNEILSWTYINDKFKSTSELSNYCPAIKELELQNLTAANYQENELPKFSDIITK